MFSILIGDDELKAYAMTEKFGPEQVTLLLRFENEFLNPPLEHSNGWWLIGIYWDNLQDADAAAITQKFYAFLTSHVIEYAKNKPYTFE